MTSPKYPERDILRTFQSIQIDDTHSSAVLFVITYGYEVLAVVLPDSSDLRYIFKELPKADTPEQIERLLPFNVEIQTLTITDTLR